MASRPTNLVQVRRPYVTPRQGSPLFFVDENGDPEESLTEQHHKDSCDVIKILKQYDRTGLITHVNKSVAQYGDFTEINEYQDSLNLVNSATDAFMELPSEIRKRFGNDPGLFFEFATNPANKAELVKMGLAYAPDEAVPQPSENENEPCEGSESL